MACTITVTPHITGGVCDYIISGVLSTDLPDIGTYTLYRNGTAQGTYPAPSPTFANDAAIVIDGSYSYYFHHTTGAGETSDTVTVTPRSVQAPSGAAASFTGAAITVTWVNNGGIPDLLELWRGVDGGAMAVYAYPIIGHAAYDDHSVSSGHSYQYKLRTYIASPYGYSAYSNTASVSIGGAGGGGGSSAGTAVAGNVGADAATATGGAPGAAPSGGGVGGHGGNSDNAGAAPASGPGGGGGGAGSDLTAARSGSAGHPGQVIITYTGVVTTDYVTRANIGTLVSGTMYQIQFQYKMVTGPGTLTADVLVGTSRQGGITGLSLGVYSGATFYFTASSAGPAVMTFTISGAAPNVEFRIDQLSLKPVTSYASTNQYSLPAGCAGIFYATLDGVEIAYGSDPYGWYYDAIHNQITFTPTSIFATGIDNLLVYCFASQIPEYVVADIMVRVGLYTDRPTALAAMTYTPTGLVIDRVYFGDGTTCLDAIRMICERCNYRFYFQYDGTPVFIPEPAIKAYGYRDWTLVQNLISDPQYYEDKSELFTTVAIVGELPVQPVGLTQTMGTNYKGSATDDGAAAQYGNPTKSISNNLFQSDAACLAIATAMLAEYKAPKRYASLTVPFNGAPLELGDTVAWQIRLSPIPGPANLYASFLYGSGVTYGSNGLVVLQIGRIRDIKISDQVITYLLEASQ